MNLASMLLALLILLCPLATAQKIVAARAGMIYAAEGDLRIDGKPYRSTGPARLPQLQDGQSVSSPRGHVEVLLGPYAVLWTGMRAQVRFDDTSVENATVTLTEGAAIIELARTLETSRVHVRAGTMEVELTREGLYRFEASGSVRVYSGEVLLPGAARLQRGEERSGGVTKPFDRKDLDEFHYWSAYRSLMLESDAGLYKQWGGPWGVREHSGFGVKFPDAPGAARMKYQVASQPALVYFLEGSAVTGTQTRNNTRLPMALSSGSFLRTEAGRAEVFLGPGVIARLAGNARLSIAGPHSSAALEEGTALIEVSESAETTPHIRVGDSETALLKSGLYSFDAKTAALRVFAGEASVTLRGASVRVREAQQLNLRQPGPLTRFDSKVHDALYKWSADRSFALYQTPAAFMTAWEPLVKQGWIKHKQFGERRDPRPQRGRPRALPSTFDMTKGNQ